MWAPSGDKDEHRNTLGRGGVGRAKRSMCHGHMKFQSQLCRKMILANGGAWGVQNVYLAFYIVSNFLFPGINANLSLHEAMYLVRRMSVTEEKKNYTSPYPTPTTNRERREMLHLKEILCVNGHVHKHGHWWSYHLQFALTLKSPCVGNWKFVWKSISPLCLYSPANHVSPSMCGRWMKKMGLLHNLPSFVLDF